jgi:hypothetical protein
LQVSIFHTLQNNPGSVDFSAVLLDVMTIADEVDSQLKQTMLGFMETGVAKSATWPAKFFEPGPQGCPKPESPSITHIPGRTLALRGFQSFRAPAVYLTYSPWRYFSVFAASRGK